MSERRSIIGLDIGPTHSAYAELCGDGTPGLHAWLPNDEVRIILRRMPGIVAMESPQPQDRPLSKVFRDTILWAGRYVEVMADAGVKFVEIDERDVALWLCGRRTSDNSALRQALLDRFGDKRQVPCKCETGTVAGKRGPKKCPACKGERFVKVPGPLAGFNCHERSALAAAVLLSEKRKARIEPLGAATAE